MISALFVSAALASAPAAATQQFRAEFPTARLRVSDQGHIALASQLDVPALAATPVESARAFLHDYGASFGVADTDTLVPTTKILPGTFGTAVFERRVEGLSVIGGHVAVMVTAEGGIHAVTSSGALPAVAARFKLDERQAVNAALNRLRGELVSVKKGWSVRAEGLHPIYLVGVVAQSPYRSHRYPVDGVTGEVGLALTMIQKATGRVYRVSPSKPYGGSCPTVNEDNHIKHTTCAPAETVTLQGLLGNGTLSGSPTPHVGRTTVYNCQGATEYNTSACKQTFLANGSGNFVPPSITDFTTNKSDLMSELMAYYQVDKQSRFLDSLDPNFVGLPLIPGFTNAYGPGLIGTGPFDNAFFDPQNKIMVFGQGSTIDFAYDGEVVYHEMTHAACGAIGDSQKVDTALFPFAHATGLMVDPLSLNEGNADAFAFMSPGVNDPELGEFDARGVMEALFGLIKIPLGPNGYVRNEGPAFFKTCQGSGTAANPGRNGEAHDDGEIWGEYAYELYQGLKKLPNSIPPGATYDSPAAPAMFSALQGVIAAPAEQQTFSTFADLLESQVRTKYGQEAGDYVQCVGERRDMDGCAGQAVTVYSGEGPANDQYVKNGWKAFYYSKAEAYSGSPPANFEGVLAGHQWKITVPAGATELKINVCDITPPTPLIGGGGSGTLFIQKGRAVRAAITGSGVTADWVFPLKASWTAAFADCGGNTPKTTEIKINASGCVGCTSKTGDTKDKLSAGTWYFLVANKGGSASFANFKATLSGSGIPTRPAVSRKTCALGVVIPGNDGGTEIDAGTEADAGTETDAGTEADAGTGTDAGTEADAGTGGGAGGGGGGAGGGGGGGESPDAPGCGGCGATGSLAPMLMLGLAALTRRRRRR